ncbi:MAG: hypothetical protein AUH15_12525 [Acidobacteriales bacterium 13_2_20CM_55_8]|nr:MAG: hypothetical protein AUH15_12525 [Acidobacteriales bacterium 13_2_20CM_55_8]
MMALVFKENASEPDSARAAGLLRCCVPFEFPSPTSVPPLPQNPFQLWSSRAISPSFASRLGDIGRRPRLHPRAWEFSVTGLRHLYTECVPDSRNDLRG